MEEPNGIIVTILVFMSFFTALTLWRASKKDKRIIDLTMAGISILMLIYTIAGFKNGEETSALFWGWFFIFCFWLSWENAKIDSRRK